MLPLATLALALAAPPDNWPQYRGPTGDGVAPASANPPTAWGEAENVRWKVAVHDKGWSSPVVWGDQVWVTTAKEDGTQFFAVCVDRKTGQTIHDVKLFDDPDPPKIAQYNSFASPTPVVEAGRAYAHFGTHGTACLDTATAKPIWARTDLRVNHWRGPASSPVVYKDKLFLLFDGHDRQYAACLDKATGKTLWLKDRDLPYPSDGDLKKGFATPSVFEVNGKPQVVAPAATGTIAYDVETGDEVWRVIHGGMNEAIRPVMAHGLIFLNSGHTSNLLAVKAGLTGDLTKTGVAWRADKVSPTRPSPIVTGDLLFMVNDTGLAFCYEAKTGTKVWQERLDGKFSASPVLAGGHVYAASEGGKTFVFKADRTFTPVAENRLAAGCKASPAVAGDALFVRTLTHLYYIGK